MIYDPGHESLKKEKPLPVWGMPGEALNMSSYFIHSQISSTHKTELHAALAAAVPAFLIDRQ